MPEYRRWKENGATYFFTVVTHGRRPIFREEQIAQALGEAVRNTQSNLPFDMLAVVLLYDHLHSIWELPTSDNNFSARWSMIKRLLSKRILATEFQPEAPNLSRRRHREAGVWQRRFWEHRNRDEPDLIAHLDYIHYNPVKHGLVACPHQWKYSTFSKWVKLGHYGVDWLCSCSGRRVQAPDFKDVPGAAGE